MPCKPAKALVEIGHTLSCARREELHAEPEPMLLLSLRGREEDAHGVIERIRLRGEERGFHTKQGEDQETAMADW